MDGHFGHRVEKKLNSGPKTRATYQPYAKLSLNPRKKLDQESQVNPGNSFNQVSYIAIPGRDPASRVIRTAMVLQSELKSLA